MFGAQYFMYLAMMDNSVVYIGGLFSAWLILFVSKWIDGRARIANLPTETRIVETIKDAISNQFSAAALSFQTEKEIKLSTHGFSIKRVVRLCSKIDRAYWRWLELSSKADDKSRSEELQNLWELRKYVFNSYPFIDESIISQALTVTITLTKLMELIQDKDPKSDWRRYIDELRDKINPQIDEFKNLVRTKYFFDSASEVIIKAQEMQTAYEEKVKDAN